MNLDEEHTPEALAEYGNTVSSTIPILMHDLRAAAACGRENRRCMVGFGVGLSWAGCTWTETWQAGQLDALADEQREAA